jgi:hypothetical protein
MAGDKDIGHLAMKKRQVRMGTMPLRLAQQGLYQFSNEYKTL